MIRIWQIARSTAIQAVTMVDRSGQLLQKWTLYVCLLMFILQFLF